MEKYPEILELADYCNSIELPVLVERLHDGYAVRFPNGGDFVQHHFSYGAESGCVEPAIGCDDDYSAVELSRAKNLVIWHRISLERPNKEGT